MDRLAFLIPIMSSSTLRRLDQRLAAPMMVASLTSLLSLAVLLHFHERTEYQAAWLASRAVSVMIWPLYVIEFLSAWWCGSPRTRERFLCCLLPPLRLAARDHETGERIWFPGWGWQAVNQELRFRLERVSNVPMIIVACLVLPLIAVEHHFAARIAEDVRWSTCVAAATTLIWLAFTLEFVVMCSVSARKLSYCKEHWLDLVIILLPLIAFLRALRLGRLLRVNQLARLTETARVYRMKGVSMRAWKALLVLDIVKRLLQGGPAQRLAKLEKLIEQKEVELAALRSEQAFLQGQITATTLPHKKAA
jgi:hypothetical protein